MGRFFKQPLVFIFIFTLISCSDHLEDGNQDFANEDYKSAVYHFEEALKMDPNNWTTIFNLARSKEEMGQYKEAIKLYSKALDLHQSTKINLGRARCYYGIDDYKSAILETTNVIKVSPNNFEATYLRAKSHIKKFNYYSAKRDLDRAIKLKPSYTNAYYHRAIAKSQLRNNYGALKDMNYVLDRKKSFGQAFFNRGIIYQRLNKFQMAKRDYTKAIRFNVKISEVYLRRGVCNYELGFSQQACKDFEYMANFNEEKSQLVRQKYCQS